MLPTTQTLISGLIEYILIFIVCLLGAYVKDVYNKLVSKNSYKLRISRILISTIFASILMYSLSGSMVPKYGIKFCLFPWFISGTVGFQVLGKVSKIGFWVNVGKAVYENKGVLQNIVETAAKAEEEEEIEQDVEKDITKEIKHDTSKRIGSIESNQSVKKENEEDKQ